MFLLICSIVLIFCAVKYIFRDKELYNFADSLPGPKAIAVIGSSHKFIKKNEQGKHYFMSKNLCKIDDLKSHSMKFDIKILLIFYNFRTV
jgi:hypothetical protein